MNTDSRALASVCEPYRELIELGLTSNRNAVSIWQELVDKNGFAGSYESLKRFVRKRVSAQVPEACAVIVTLPGEEAQVDYETGPLVRNSQTGKHRRTRLFVFTLGFSRKCVRLLSFQSSSPIWGELHETAFQRMGGTPKVIVRDNLRDDLLVHFPDGIVPILQDGGDVGENEPRNDGAREAETVHRDVSGLVKKEIMYSCPHCDSVLWCGFFFGGLLTHRPL